jgi:hypothetical protein
MTARKPIFEVVRGKNQGTAGYEQQSGTQWATYQAARQNVMFAVAAIYPPFVS